VTYVTFRRRDECLLTADNLGELHSFAAGLGLRLARYFPGLGYVLTPAQRYAALTKGAVWCARVDP
jgi:hypothetical protein